MKKGDLISPAYAEQQKQLHARPAGYGGKGAKWADVVLGLARELDATSILDYGCGQGTLASAVRDRDDSGVIRVDEYDPAIKGKDHLPGFADLVTCTDVLEHIEPERLDTVLAHLRALARKAVFVVIATRPASKVLADGRNAHLIIEQAPWWLARVTASGFTVSNLAPVSPSKKPSREWVAVLLP
jgi:2-polyprenyl-3-methyl-5-hydroxy-6-metoxy-1,4-benzoquinol methylase